MRRDSTGRKITPKGEGGVILGRKFCNSCGIWRLLYDFHSSQRTSTGTTIVWQSECRACARVRRREARGHNRETFQRESREVLKQRARERLYADPERLARRREYDRIYKEAKRREAGIPPREWRPDGPRNLSSHNGKEAMLDAQPFLEWLGRYVKATGVAEYDLAASAGTTDRRFRDARDSGRISELVADRVLTYANGPALAQLYPR